MVWFIPMVKQLQKYLRQPFEFVMVWSDRLCLLLHESWADFCTKKDSFSDGAIVSCLLEFHGLWTQQVSLIIL